MIKRKQVGDAERYHGRRLFATYLGPDLLANVDEPLDPALLAKVMSGVRLEVRLPMRLRVSKLVGGKVQDSHEFEVDIGADISATQKQMQSIAGKWKGGFEVGMVYTVERVA